MYHILNIYWTQKNNGEFYSPKIKIYDSINKDIKSFELSGYDFKFKLSEKRYCTGYYKDGEFKICKLAGEDGIGVELDPGFDQCRVCEKIMGFKSAFFYQGEANENAQKHLSQTHYIYLTYFEPGIIKVGTAAESRKLIRPIEQDGLIYAYIAQSDGFNIQKLERFISKNVGVTEFVKSGHKFKYLAENIQKEKAEDLIKSTFQKIEMLLGDNMDFQGWLFDSIKIIDVSEKPPFFFPTEKINQIKTYENLAGNYLGLRGRYLLLNNYGKIVAFDTKQIVGRTFEYLDENFEYKIEGDAQLGFEL